jgi:hypothetical protein
MPTDEAQRQSAILAHNLNDMTRNLSVEYNTYTDLRNQQHKVLNKYDKYIELQNRKLAGQLQELQNIESRVATRDSLVRGNQHAYQEKIKRLQVLKAFFVITAYLIFVIVAYLGHKVSLAFLLTNMMVVLAVYTGYYLWIYNYFGMRHFTHFVDREAKRAEKDIYEAGRDIENQINQYVNGECDCPDDKKKNGGKHPSKHHPAGVLPKNDGIYYYDGTAPQQRLHPEVENKNFAIEWEVAPDMGSRDNKRFTPPPTYMPDTAALPKGSLDGEYKGCTKVGGTTGKGKPDTYSTWTSDL